jgi:hypothetical protein
LGWTVAGTSGVVAAMLALGIALATRNPVDTASPLQPKVEQYRTNEGPTASVRLSEPLQKKISLLADLKNDADFARLLPELQEYVNQRLQELRDYQAFKEKLTQARAPEQARNDKDLAEIRKRLETELAIPDAYRSEWSETDAALLRTQRLKEAAALANEADRIEQWFRGLKQRGDELWATAGKSPWNVWYASVRDLLRDAAAQLFAPGDRLPDPAAKTITYAVVLRFDRVADARADWDKRKQELESLAELTAALGLAGTARPVLQIPTEGITLDQARTRWRELEEWYPNYANWSRLALPDAASAAVRQTARTDYDRLLSPAHELILRQLQQLSPDGKETPERWRELRDWLASTKELAGWRELATLLAQLADVKAGDPVADLLAFLKHDRFELDLRALTLTLPDSLKARPVGSLVIYHRSGDNPTATYRFAQTGEPQHDAVRGITRFSFAPDSRVQLAYKPADGVWAELALTKDANGVERSLSWSGSRSLTYQFQRLLSHPRLLRKGQKDTEGVIASDVTLSVTPEGGIPRVPDLMPVVILKKR